MKNFFRRNLAIKLLSLFSAFVLWLYVAYQNPANDQILPRVSLEYRNLPKELAVVSMPDSVSVRVQGALGFGGQLTYKDVRAEVDLANARVGNNLLSVKVTVPNGANLLSVTPEQAAVRLDVIRERQVPVKVRYSGQPKLGYIRLSAVLDPDQVLVRGPRALLEQIHEAYVEANLDGATGNFNQSLPVSLLDSKGNILNDNRLQLTPTGVDVFIPVVKKLPTREVPVRPVVVGKPAAGYRVSQVIFDPKFVTISGSTGQLSNVSALGTEQVDISGAKDDVAKEVRLIGPPGISWPGSNIVKVVVQIQALPAPENTRQVKVELRNVPHGRLASATPDTVQIVWSSAAEGGTAAQPGTGAAGAGEGAGQGSSQGGTQGTGQGIGEGAGQGGGQGTNQGGAGSSSGGSDEVKAWADVSGLAPGTYHLPVQAQAPAGYTVDQIQPATVTVTVSNEGKPAGG